GLAAVQELADAEVAAGQVLEQAIVAPAGLEAQTADRSQHARALKTRTTAPTKGADLTVEARPGGAGERCRLELAAIGLVKSCHVVGKNVGRRTVDARPGSDVEHREPQLRMALDDV